MPASPRLISCPPPTRQITTAQSAWRSKYDSRNSGSDCVKPGSALLAAHEVGGHLAIPCALRLVENDDVIAGWSVLVQSFISEVVHVLNERFDLLLHDSFAGFVILGAQALSFRRAPRASRSTFTSGPLPDKNTAWVGVSSRFFVATLRPTSVLPAPGTPVTKTMAFRPPSGRGR